MQFRDWLPKLYRPEVYQGGRNPDRYFEGWYCKLVDPGGDQIWSFIPGISYSDDTHCFIQAIHANSGRTFYVRYPADRFRYDRKKFFIRVGDSTFSTRGIDLQLETKELKVSGNIRFTGVRPFPSTLVSPGIMGYYSYAPRMECYHGVVSMQHGLEGSLEIDGTPAGFTGGKGYMEKDWGRSMPSDWIWIQSNHFGEDPGASCMLSVARIPWMNGFFPGFLSFFLLDGNLYRFATYNRSRITRIHVAEERVEIGIQNRKYRVGMAVERVGGGTLKAPRHGSMDRDIAESIISRLELELTDRSGNLVFRGAGLHAGLEIVGDVARYFTGNH